MILRYLLLSLAIYATSEAAFATQNPWTAMADRDLRAIHDAIEDNHPGPVDSQNPHYRQWLDRGLQQALLRADGAVSLNDYERALKFYTNGFQDDHVGVYFFDHGNYFEWPGFIVGQTSPGAVEVVYAQPDAGVSKGARLLGCDGVGLNAILKERVDPYYWNAAIPAARYDNAYRLFYQETYDSQTELHACTFSTGTVTLKWQYSKEEDFQKIRDHALGRDSGSPSIRQIDGVWIISLPSFAYKSNSELASIHGVIAQIAKHAAELRKAVVVIDVRGNLGGDSDWGNKIATALWGSKWVDHANAKIGGNIVDWRASTENLAMLVRDLTQAKKAGTDLSYLTSSISAIQKAIKRHQPLARVVDAAPTSQSPPPANLIPQKVYFLTDGACMSACLDFADLMRNLPGVMDVGLPTGADTVYMEVGSQILPSGLAQIGYGMKVIRDRARKNNQGYTPQFRWPGGPMNDDRAIVRWIKSLH